MKIMGLGRFFASLQVIAVALASPAAAQDEGAADTVATVDMAAATSQVDPATIAMPELAFIPDPKFAKDFDKYYYFHRDDADFAAALADLRACDNLARGLARPLGNLETPYPYNMTTGGLIGGAIGNAMVAAIFGSAQVRAMRRVNMRRCMFYKGYDRYGLPKDLWQEFNFEEGFSDLSESKRQGFLMQQAKVASGPKPSTEVLGK